MKLLRQAAELAGVVGESLVRLLGDDEVIVPPSTQRDRLARCQACPELRRQAGGSPSCAACGCAVERKAAVAAAACPHGRWPR